MQLSQRAPSWRALLAMGAFTVLVLPFAAAADETSPAAGLPLEEQVQYCGFCHGSDGNSTQPGTPSLAGQPALAITNQLIYFRERLRQSEIMTPQARGLDDEEIQAMAAYYADQPVAEPEGERDADLAKQGQEIVTSQGCASCHSSDYSGREQMPRLAGQREDYLFAAMVAYRDRTRGGPDTTMIDIMRGISDEDIEAMAHHLAHFDD
ncbi:cytochrome c [Halomonas sp. QHL1]|uniref:c-type cytochrome n=1 Tax=Halomonas sp. QHL1 TaxID=1123773 RepID=UPI0009F9671C|nr:c-type cytochrome [Halomonas sp. QHL1]